MIPKIIHYCWLSNDLFPPKIQRCIDSWSRVLPDYELRLWNFERLGDACPAWVREAYETKKYAFAADWVRAYALATFGGIYLDSDVEMLKPFDALLDMPYFVCRESSPGWNLEAACMGAEKGQPLFVEALRYYDGRHFVRPDGTYDDKPMPHIFADIIRDKFTLRPIDNPSEFVADEATVCMLPSEYFSPLQVITMEMIQTPRTMAIHHFAGSWKSESYMRKKRIQQLIGPRATRLIQRIKGMITH